MKKNSVILMLFVVSAFGLRAFSVIQNDPQQKLKTERIELEKKLTQSEKNIIADARQATEMPDNNSARVAQSTSTFKMNRAKMMEMRDRGASQSEMIQMSLPNATEVFEIAKKYSDIIDPVINDYYNESFNYKGDKLKKSKEQLIYQFLLMDPNVDS